MNYLNYLFLFFISTFSTIYLSFFIGHIIGEGSNQLSLVIASIAILNATIVTLFFIYIKK